MGKGTHFFKIATSPMRLPIRPVPMVATAPAILNLSSQLRLGLRSFLLESGLFYRTLDTRLHVLIEFGEAGVVFFFVEHFWGHIFLRFKVHVRLCEFLVETPSCRTIMRHFFPLSVLRPLSTCRAVPMQPYSFQTFRFPAFDFQT